VISQQHDDESSYATDSVDQDFDIP
jgi:hypothetical protein